MIETERGVLCDSGLRKMGLSSDLDVGTGTGGGGCDGTGGWPLAAAPGFAVYGLVVNDRWNKIIIKKTCMYLERRRDFYLHLYRFLGGLSAATPRKIGRLL